jgi:hypothetical protein
VAVLTQRRASRLPSRQRPVQGRWPVRLAPGAPTPAYSQACTHKAPGRRAETGQSPQQQQAPELLCRQAVSDGASLAQVGCGGQSRTVTASLRLPTPPTAARREGLRAEPACCGGGTGAVSRLLRAPVPPPHPHALRAAVLFGVSRIDVAGCVAGRRRGGDMPVGFPSLHACPLRGPPRDGFVCLLCNSIAAGLPRGLRARRLWVTDTAARPLRRSLARTASGVSAQQACPRRSSLCAAVLGACP